ncbi:hypothetical protein OH77DRAFT_1420379 [Trametes cingulata]|nr:hypothetical protein OH77DRAFT_1420379 [Trametes cingulata]
MASKVRFQSCMFVVSAAGGLCAGLSVWRTGLGPCPATATLRRLVLAHCAWMTAQVCSSVVSLQHVSWMGGGG